MWGTHSDERMGHLLLLVLACTVTFTVIKISSMCHVYLHVGILRSQFSTVRFLVDTYNLQFYI
jgi:hypothetical protein